MALSPELSSEKFVAVSLDTVWFSYVSEKVPPTSADPENRANHHA